VVLRPVRIVENVVVGVPPKELWTFLSDTERMNRAVHLPPVTFLPLSDRSKKGHYSAETSWFGLKLSYEELPFEWVEQRYYRIERRFPTGPLEKIVGGLTFLPSDAGTKLEVFADIQPRNWLGALVAGKVGKSATRGIMELARAFDRHRADPVRQPPPALPPSGTVREDVLDTRLGYVKVSGPTQKLRQHLLTAGDLDVVGMRPFELADRWGEDRMAVLRYFLNAARAGALDLTWNVICPNCRIPSRKFSTLSSMKSEAHCDTCDIKYDADFARSVEARFSVHPAVRDARRAIYCIGGPANMPDIVAQLRLEARESRKEPLPEGKGTLRIRCYQAPGIHPLWGTRVKIDSGGVGVETGESGLLDITNALPGEALVVIERDSWRDAAATAALVTSLQEFRDLFPSEAVAPGEEIGISSLAILFTDLKGSTDLYQKLGDSRAFAFVQNHFRYLVEKVTAHRGGVVKTMGDAVMATFASGRDALEAAMEMQAGWETFRQGHGNHEGLGLRIGLHQGPAIAINNAGKLDFFGTTVNMAARVQAKSDGADVLFTQAIEDDPQAKEYLHSIRGGRETMITSLKGLTGDHTLIRTRPVPK
jgi:class 3 adenylate cyclase